MDSSDALQLRIRAATEKDVLLGMFFDSSIENLQRQLGPTEAETVRRDVFGSRSIVSFFRYPVADLLKLVDLGVKRNKTSARSYDDSIAEFGRAAVNYFFDSQAGKMMSFLSGDEPHRLMASSPAAYKAVSAFGERAYERVGPRSGKLICQGEFLGPAWTQGVVEQALLKAAKVHARVRVEVKNPSGSDFIVHVEW
ncbi:TIGR02265 family protein [Archangium violaceum]|uniref:TIGR02265 family protein n=1 Tax=Archangium violaceum TaxID=83451 RepID=UPI0036D84D49